MDNDEEITQPLDEMSLLKERAKTMGIPISGNISKETLKSRIEAKMAGLNADNDVETDTDEDAEPVKETEQQLRDRLYREQMKLVRCRIYNLNPMKNDLRGEIITVANRYLGTVRKFIPFGEATDNGYHIPQIIYDDLKSRQFQQVRTRNVRGQILVDTRMVPEYNIEVMPPLTEAELKELAIKQAAAERVGIPE